MLLSETFSLTVGIFYGILFPVAFLFNVACIYRHFCRSNQYFLMMSIMSSVSFASNVFFLLSRFFVLDFLYFLSSAKSESLLIIDFLQFLLFDQSDFLEDESNNEGSDSGSAGTYDFLFSFYDFFGRVGESVGCVSGVGSDVFSPTRIKSIGDVLLEVVFLPKGVNSKGG